MTLMDWLSAFREFFQTMGMLLVAVGLIYAAKTARLQRILINDLHRRVVELERRKDR